MWARVVRRSDLATYGVFILPFGCRERLFSTPHRFNLRHIQLILWASWSHQAPSLLHLDPRMFMKSYIIHVIGMGGSMRTNIVIFGKGILHGRLRPAEGGQRQLMTVGCVGPAR
jgi:hypothetical protein